MSERKSRVKTNRHRSTDGREWGWVERPDGKHVLFWTGQRQRKLAHRRAQQLDEIGWGHMTEGERSHVRNIPADALEPTP